MFDIVGEIRDVQTIATGSGIRNVQRLRKNYGPSRWRKLKGIAIVRLFDGSFCEAEIHWYEAHGIGRKEIKIKRLIV